MELMFLFIPREILPPITKKIKQKEGPREIKEGYIYIIYTLYYIYIYIYNSSELIPLHSTKTKQNTKKSLELLTLESTEITEDT